MVEGIGIPLLGHGGEIRAFTMVDAEDFERLSAFRWNIRQVGPRRYVTRVVKRDDGPLKRLLIHREIMGLEIGDPLRVDHINGDTLDNRRANLRVVTDGQNSQNQRPRPGSSRYRGVTRSKRKRKWAAQGCVAGRSYNLGYYENELEAACVAAEWRSKNMPFSEEALAVREGRPLWWRSFEQLELVPAASGNLETGFAAPTERRQR